MALVTVQRSPSPSDTSERSQSDEEDGLTPPRQRRSKSPLHKFRRILNSVKFLSKIRRRRFSESYFAVKGTALALAQTECPRRVTTRFSHSDGISSHLQSMFYLLRPQDTIKVAVKLEAQLIMRHRYMVVVSCMMNHNHEECVILGIDCNETVTIGLVLPIYSDMRIELNGDGGFHIMSHGHKHQFKPISVPAMWSVLQSLYRVVNNAASNKFFPNSQSHSWVEFYHSRIKSDRSRIIEWFFSGESGSVVTSVTSDYDDSPNEELQVLMNYKLREIMMTVDLDEVSGKFIRTSLEESLGCDLSEFKSYIDRQTLFIYGQMDAASYILPNLYLGSEWNASNLEELKVNGVWNILNISREIDNFFPGMFKYMNVREFDVEETDLLRYWDKTFTFISQARQAGHSVLVHCKMGVSRSAATVIAYVMKEMGWSLEETIKYVRGRRSCIKPLPSFIKQLEIYQGILNASRQRYNSLFKSKSETNLQGREEGSDREGMRSKGSFTLVMPRHKSWSSQECVLDDQTDRDYLDGSTESGSSHGSDGNIPVFTLHTNDDDDDDDDEEDDDVEVIAHSTPSVHCATKPAPCSVFVPIASEHPRVITPSPASPLAPNDARDAGIISPSAVVLSPVSNFTPMVSNVSTPSVPDRLNGRGALLDRSYVRRPDHSWILTNQPGDDVMSDDDTQQPVQPQTLVDIERTLQSTSSVVADTRAHDTSQPSGPSETTEYNRDTVEIPDETTEYNRDTVEIPDETMEYNRDTVEIPDETTEYNRDTVEIPDETTEYNRDTVEIPDETMEYNRDTVEIPDETMEYNRDPVETEKLPFNANNNKYAISDSSLATSSQPHDIVPASGQGDFASVSSSRYTTNIHPIVPTLYEDSQRCATLITSSLSFEQQTSPTKQEKLTVDESKSENAFHTPSNSERKSRDINTSKLCDIPFGRLLTEKYSSSNDKFTDGSNLESNNLAEPILSFLNADFGESRKCELTSDGSTAKWQPLVNASAITRLRPDDSWIVENSVKDCDVVSAECSDVSETMSGETTRVSTEMDVEPYNCNHAESGVTIERTNDVTIERTNDVTIERTNDVAIERTNDVINTDTTSLPARGATPTQRLMTRDDAISVELTNTGERRLRDEGVIKSSVSVGNVACDLSRGQVVMSPRYDSTAAQNLDPFTAASRNAPSSYAQTISADPITTDPIHTDSASTTDPIATDPATTDPESMSDIDVGVWVHYVKEAIPWNPGTVKKQAEEIEGLNSCDDNDAVTKPVQRSSSLKILRVSRLISAERRKTCTPILSPESSEADCMSKTLPVAVYCFGDEEVPLKVGLVRKHTQEFENMTVDDDSEVVDTDADGTDGASDDETFIDSGPQGEVGGENTQGNYGGSRLCARPAQNVFIPGNIVPYIVQSIEKRHSGSSASTPPSPTVTLGNGMPQCEATCSSTIDGDVSTNNSSVVPVSSIDCERLRQGDDCDVTGRGLSDAEECHAGRGLSNLDIGQSEEYSKCAGLNKETLYLIREIGSALHEPVDMDGTYSEPKTEKLSKVKRITRQIECRSRKTPLSERLVVSDKDSPQKRACYRHSSRDSDVTQPAFGEVTALCTMPDDSTENSDIRSQFTQDVEKRIEIVEKRIEIVEKICSDENVRLNTRDLRLTLEKDCLYTTQKRLPKLSPHEEMHVDGLEFISDHFVQTLVGKFELGQVHHGGNNDLESPLSSSFSLSFDDLSTVTELDESLHSDSERSPLDTAMSRYGTPQHGYIYHFNRPRNQFHNIQGRKVRRLHGKTHPLNKLWPHNTM